MLSVESEATGQSRENASHTRILIFTPRFVRGGFLPRKVISFVRLSTFARRGREDHKMFTLQVFDLPEFD